MWIPKEEIDIAVIRNNLTIEVGGYRKGSGRLLTMWRETAHHLVVPREYLTEFQEASLIQATGPIIPEALPLFERVHFEDNIQLYANQQESWKALQVAERGILALSCGRGKTVLACKKIAQGQAPTMVISNSEASLSQWADAFVQFLGARREDIGWVSSGKRTWDRPLVLGMIHSIAKHADRWSEGFKRRFGQVWFDEIHHLSAPMFSRSAPLFHGQRFGCTATPIREDGTHHLYYFHVGRPFHEDYSHELEPSVSFVRLETYIDLNSSNVRNEITDATGEVHFGKFRIYLASMGDRNRIILQYVKQKLNEGRKVLCLTHAREHPYILQKLLPGSLAVTGPPCPVSAADRSKVMRKHKVVFATAQVAAEALDDPRTDTVLFMTPFGSERELRQSIGRALRPVSDKKPPEVIIFEDYHVPLERGSMRDLRAYLSALGHDFEIRYHANPGKRRRVSAKPWTKKTSNIVNIISRNYNVSG